MARGSIEKIIQVAYTQGDMFSRMTAGAMLREAQQIAMEHCDGLGFTVPVLLEHHRLFMLFKLELNIKRAPLEGEKLRLITTAYAPERIVFRRICRFETLDGELCAEYDSRWAMVDTVTRRIARDTVPGLNELMCPPEKFDDIRAARVTCDEEADAVRVRYTMLDTNGHANNAWYADWITDALEDPLTRGAELRKLRLFYHNQAMPGDTVRLMKTEKDGVIYFAGEGSNGRCFDAEAELTAPLGDDPAPLPFYA